MGIQPPIKRMWSYREPPAPHLARPKMSLDQTRAMATGSPTATALVSRAVPIALSLEKGLVMTVMAKGVALMLVISISLSACVKSPAEKASVALAKGLAAHRAGKLDEARALYNEVLKNEPRNKFGYYNLGLLAQTRGDNISAENDYRLAISIDPNFTSPLFNLAIILAAKGSDNEAMELYRKVIALEPRNAGAHLNLGLILRKTGDHVQGDAEVAKALELDPSLAKRLDESASRASPAPSPSK